MLSFSLAPRAFAGLVILATVATLSHAASAPSVSTAAASNVTSTGATINALVSANGATTTIGFQYGLTTTYGASLGATPWSISASASGVSANATLSGLSCGRTYHVRAGAQNSLGIRVGSDVAFTTAACAPPPPTPVAPTTTTNPASGITTTAATLNGSVTAGSAAATVSFDYGTTTAYGTNAAAVPANLAAGSSATAVSRSLSGLSCATTYNYRVRAVSSAGTAVGANRTFATASCAPPPPPPAPTACSSTSVRCVSATSGENQEYSTIQAAVSAAVAGDTVLVFDGNYVGFVASRSGTASAPIVIRAQGSAAVIDRPSSAGEGIRVNNASYVVIEGFTVTGISGFGLAARGATATAPMRGVVFRDNTVRNSGSSNIYASQVADSLIEGNSSTGSGSSHGIYLANAGSGNTVIRGNHTFSNFENGIHLNGDASVGGDGIQTGITIEDNIVNGNGANGVNLDGVQASTIRNNVIYDNTRHGVRGYRIDASAGPRDMLVVNNTIVVRSGNTPVKFTEDQGGHTIFNNILVNEGASGGSIVVGHATLKSDRNMFVNPGFSLNGGSSMLTLSQWRAQAGAYDTGSLASTQAALFLASSARDYRLRAGSPAANAGVATFNGRAAPAMDIDGVARPLGPAHDQGAFESF